MRTRTTLSQSSADERGGIVATDRRHRSAQVEQSRYCRECRKRQSNREPSGDERAGGRRTTTNANNVVVVVVVIIVVVVVIILVVAVVVIVFVFVVV